MRLCIANGVYHKPGETFVNRHIEHAFGGDTCVVAQKLTGANPYGKPAISRMGARRRTAEWPEHLVASLRDAVLYRSSNVPTGPARRAVEAFLREQRVEAVLAEFGNHAVALAPVARGLGLPMFTYFRGYDASRYIQRANHRAAYRRLMPQLTGVFAVSQFLLDQLGRHGIAHPEARVIPSGVDVRRFVPGAKRPQSVLAVGRMHEKKAADLTVRAFCTAARDHPAATLDVVGDGALLEPCRKLAAEAGMADRITFHGAEAHEAVQARMATAQIFAQHSVTGRDGNTEGLPTSIQEAMASGCVVVSTRHAGIPEAVEDGRTGWLVAEHDLAGYTDRMARALAGEGLGAMATAARAAAEAKFDNAVLLARMESRIEALSRAATAR